MGDYGGAVLKGVDVEGKPVAAFAFDFLDEVGRPRRVARGGNYMVAVRLGEAGEGEAEAGGAASYKPR